jgi:putative salt-induced outer membrane protein YdiY
MILALAGAALRAEETHPKNWKNESELSAVSSNGNTRASSFSGKDTFTSKWGRTGLELIGGGLGSKSNGQTTAENYYASEKVSYSLDEKNYVFEKGGWTKDRFAGIKNRYEGTLGLGRILFSRPQDLLIGELGTGYTSEERKNEKTNGFSSGRAYSKYTRTISETAKFSQDAEYLHNFEDPDDFRVKTETALIAALSTHFSLKTAYVWKHVGQPPVGFHRNDTITSVSLIAIY